MSKRRKHKNGNIAIEFLHIVSLKEASTDESLGIKIEDIVLFAVFVFGRNEMDAAKRSIEIAKGNLTYFGKDDEVVLIDQDSELFLVQTVGIGSHPLEYMYNIQVQRVNPGTIVEFE